MNNYRDKFLLIIGGSGCGKTTLAKNLEEFYPEKYHRVKQYSTRKPRPGEVDGVDYYFITENEYDSLRDKMFEKVECQFPPNKYGASFEEIVNEKWNVVVVSLEALFSMLNNISSYNTPLITIMNIVIDDDLDIPEREGRNSNFEENTNLGVLRNLSKAKYCELFSYREIKLSELKECRNDREKLDLFMNAKVLPELSTAYKIKMANNAEELSDIIADLDCKFGNDIESLIFYRCLALKIDSADVYIKAINKINNKLNF